MADVDISEVDISEFEPTIKSILRESDPYEITARDVRRKLEQKFNVDLTPRKQEIQKLIDRCFDDLDMIGEEVEPKVSKRMKHEDKKQINNHVDKKQNGNPEEKLKKKKKGRPPKTPVKVRESDYSSLEDESPQQKKKRGRKPKSSSTIAESSDAEYERKFEEELLNESNAKKSKSKSNGTTKKKSNKRKKRDDDEQDGEERKKRKKGNTGIHKPLILSPVLAAFLQAEEMSRLEVVKRLWAYIKEHGLQDPNDKRFIVCDSRLLTIFNQDRIHSFTMNKFLTDHLKKKEAPTDIDTNGTSAVHYDNRTSKSIDEGNNLDDNISRDQKVEVKIEAQGEWENLDDEDNEEIEGNEGNEENEENEENEDNEDNEDEDLFGDDDPEWDKPEDGDE